MPPGIGYPGLLAGARQFPGLLGDPVPRLAGATGLATLPNRMNAVALPPRPPSPAAQSGGLGNALGFLFGGANNPDLTPEQNEQARNQAMLMAGLQTILASEQGGSALGALAQGAIAGQQAGAGARENLYMSTQEERLRQALADPELMSMLTPRQRRIIQLMPPAEATKALSEILTQTPETKVVGDALVDNSGNVLFENPAEPPPVNLQRFMDGDGTIRSFNPRTGETSIVRDAKGNPVRGQVATTEPNWQVLQTAAGTFQINPRTGEVRPLVGPDGAQLVEAPTSPRRPTEVQMRMQVVLPRAEAGLDYIENFIAENGDVPEESFLGKALPGRYLQSPEVQQFDQAAEAVASALLRVESGAAITSQELESYKRQFIPRPGDTPEVIKQKLDMIRATLAQMRQTSDAAPKYSSDNPFK